MNPCTALHSPTQPPPWLGESRIHILEDEPEAKPVKLKAWTLVRPGSDAERSMLAKPFVWEFPA